MIMEAEYYQREPDGSVICRLCPHNCRIKNDHFGICGTRKNKGGKLYSEVYGMVSGYAIDPIEKKPLYHYFPGKEILSVGSYGCNMKCRFCQNHDISQTGVSEIRNARRSLKPEKIAADAKGQKNNIGIAFTYNEPLVWFEYMRDIAISAKSKGLKTVMVSNGYISYNVLDEICGLTDAFNIDLKAFNEKFYKELTGASIQPVLEALKQIRSRGSHLEITYLVIPGMNDEPSEFEDCSKWISENLGKETVLHLSRYFPRYRMTGQSTPASTLERFHDIASQKLKYVYTGNINLEGKSDTRCPECNTLITKRTAYHIENSNINDRGECIRCGEKIYNHFS